MSPPPSDGSYMGRYSECSDKAIVKPSGCSVVQEWRDEGYGHDRWRTDCKATELMERRETDEPIRLRDFRTSADYKSGRITVPLSILCRSNIEQALAALSEGAN